MKNKIKFTQRNYVRKGRYFKEVEILKELNHLNGTNLTRNEKQLIKVLRHTLAEISCYKTKMKITEKAMSDIYKAWNNL